MTPRLLVLASLAVVTLASPARADEVLRMASIAPEGTSFARALRGFAQKVETESNGHLRIKWYLSGIAGDEVEADARVRRDQLDGVASGGNLCQRLAPSLKVLRIVGLVRDRDEAAYVFNRLKPDLDREFREHGYANLAEVGMGAALLFSRTPIRNFDDLRKTRLFVWADDDPTYESLTAMKLQAVRLPINEAAAAYTANRIDTFTAPPSAALAFQWSALAHYYTDLHLNFVTGCLVVANRAFDRLTPESQAVLRSATAELQVHLRDALDESDRQLLGGLLAKQGLTAIHVDARFNAEFLEAASAARDKLVDKLMPRAVLDRVLAMLADRRGER